MAALSIGFTATAANAATVTLDFGFTVNDSSYYANSGPANGTKGTLRVTLDDTIVPVAFFGGAKKQYTNAITSEVFSIDGLGSQSLNVNSSQFEAITEDTNFGLTAGFNAIVANAPTSDPREQIDFNLLYNSGTAPNPMDLAALLALANSGDLSDLFILGVAYRFQAPTGAPSSQQPSRFGTCLGISCAVSGQVTSLSVLAPVPLPAGGLLLLTGLGGLIVARRRMA
ncbi:VPLPA-CTERM sorting domain-containing protein [Algirhabdus cladophorae]|uniref:VPLPA-CTERM sorting domain-containing protein n=1 Tax=Algirhabdus cladophorae TaxID=3377108 RepID=UPI003B84A7F7